MIRQTFLYNLNTLFSLPHHSPEIVEAFRQDADAVMEAGPFSVMDKPLTPPSGDKHDYMSIGPYWWPNPDTPDGLPYIRRDGETNPERHLLDNKSLTEMCRTVETLALASFLTNTDYRSKGNAYFKRARMLLRAWFIDPATRMNPHLEYGQSIPGICEGRGIGIIDTAERFTRLVDNIRLLETFEFWHQSDIDGMHDWMNSYLDWLLTSAKGLEEDAQPNNHGTWYDIQVVAVSCFTGRYIGRKPFWDPVLKAAKKKRILAQIQPDGSQPHELARTNGLSYSIYNLRAMYYLAIYRAMTSNAENATPYTGLWRVGAENDVQENALLRKALLYLAPYVLKQEPFPYQQIDTGFDAASALFPLAQWAAYVYQDDEVKALAEALPVSEEAQRRALLSAPVTAP